MSGASSLRTLLLPFTPLYRVGLAIREASLHAGREPIRRLGWPVVSIGNLSTGGAGKTPLTIALARALTARGVHVDVLSRGYGRTSRTAARVDPDGTAQDFGDEPLVIAREAGVPVYVAAERYEAGLLAEQEYACPQDASLQAGDGNGPAQVTAEQSSETGHDHGASSGQVVSGGEDAQPGAEASAAEAGNPSRVHLLDDGFQHRQLARAVDILLLNRRDWSDHLLPAGNLREPRTALTRAHVIAVPAHDPELEARFERYGWTGLIWRLRRNMQVQPLAGPVIAFCGIAHSRQFFAGLEAAGLHLASRVAFADHHPYIAHDIDCLLDGARSVRAVALVTTEKDLARLGGLAARIPESLPLITAKLSLEIEDEAAAIDWLLARLQP